MTIFSASGVSKQYANHRALDRVSIEVPEGSIFGLLGPNGAGKTTLIRIINQIIAPDEGTLTYLGRPLQPSDTATIGYLPEERGLYKKMTVGEQAVYLAQLKGLPKEVARQRLQHWFTKFEIQGWWGRKVEELSKGMQQKVQFLVTIIHEPRLLIFDEPFSGFDPINASMLKDEILALKKSGSTIIFSTHNMASVEELCDHIALINHSKVILHGSMPDIRKQYKSNTYKINYLSEQPDLRSFLPASFELLGSGTDHEMLTATIKIPEGSSANKLLESMIPFAEVHSLQEIIPSMNDIFIKTVTSLS